MISNRKTVDAKAYSKLENDLRKMILKNQLEYDQAITPETELAKSYGISRNTARKALSNLTDEGLLKKIQGRGTFVVPPEQRQQISKFKVLMVMTGYNRQAPIKTYDRNLVAGALSYGTEGMMECQCLHPTEFNEEETLRSYQNAEIQGIIWDRPQKETHEMIKRISEHGIPQLTISHCVPGVPSMVFDVGHSIKVTLKYLKMIGHQKVAFIDLNSKYKNFINRQKTFVEEISKNDITDPESCLCLFKSEPLAIEAFKTLPDDITAAIVASYVMENFIAWNVERGVRIPEDLALVSLSTENSKELRDYPALSAIIDPRYEIGHKAVEIIHAISKGEAISNIPLKIKGKLMVSEALEPPC